MEDPVLDNLEDPSFQSSSDGTSAGASTPLWLALLVSTLAGGMGWGIRGQYGHETGAMVPGVLVALSLVFLFASRASSLRAARAVALAAVAFGFGGSMTYGQTVGLTHDSPLIGNSAAYWWGMLGLFIKGGVWIGLAGAFLGMGLGGKRYSVLETVTLLAVMMGLLFLGRYLLNEPFRPFESIDERKLPPIYFSDHWDWEPGNLEMKPRRECWGGLWFALLGLVGYFWWIKKDCLARNLSLTGIFAGGFGFSIGQSVQAFRQWNPDTFKEGFLRSIDAYMNWWNMMEITFGWVLGFGLALGLWLSRHHIADLDEEDDVELEPRAEWFLVGMHAIALYAWTLMDFDVFDDFGDLAITMGFVPILGIIAGRWWPYMLTLPLLAIPICLKTLRAMSFGNEPKIPLIQGSVYFVVIPLAIMVGLAVLFARRGERGQTGRAFTRWALLVSTWMYFALNFAYFDFPWPWNPPTGRTPSAWIFIVSAVIMSLVALTYGWRRQADLDQKLWEESATEVLPRE